ncbi:DUF1015 family protein [Actinomadura craniellae]|nr:DUF1015 domain-containing protein [Actinomadura craniellae]
MHDDASSDPDPEEFSSRIFGAGPPDPRAREAGLELLPFRGVRFVPEVVGDLATVTAPPYDLIDDSEADGLRASDSHNIVRLILPHRTPGGAPADPYRQADAVLRSWLTEGALTVDPEPALYVYEVRGGDTLQRGLIGAVGLRPESAGVVLPHENVFPGPVRDRLALMSATRANLEPIFLLYDGDAGGVADGDGTAGAAARVVEETAAGEDPVVEVTAGGLAYRLWRVANPAEHARVAADLRGRRALIADGHHRYATYRALQARHRAAGAGAGPWDHGLALLVDSARYPARLGAIHRVLPDLPPEEAVDRAKEVFRVTEAPADPDAARRALAGATGPAFLLGGGTGPRYLLTEPDPVRLEQALPPGRSARWRRLDTAVLDHLLISGVWGVAESEHTVHVVHHDPAAAFERARRTGGTAVILNPLRTEDVLAVAEGGERVPRKSTSFGPKPRTGLVFRLFD